VNNGGYFLHYFIGIDGGGTKTAICAASIEASSLQYIKTSGSSWREYGVSEVVFKLKKAVDELMGGEKKKLTGIAMGLPCYGESVEGDRILTKALNDAFTPIPLYITNDVEAGWAGSLALSPGINIVAGTGSIAYGKDTQGRTVRCGGWSEFFGDEGSCYWVGHKAMEYFSKQADGRLPKDELYTVIRRELDFENDVSFIDIIHDKYLGFRKQVASLQMLVEKAALAGSVSAKSIYEQAVNELCLLVRAARAQLDFKEKPWAVSYSGGLFKAKDLVLLQFTKAVEKEGGKIVHPCFEPVEGALLLAFQHFCPNGLSDVQKLIKEKK
jgi:N-acetylglucosamine kinase-like BadF-type ATPase